MIYDTGDFQHQLMKEIIQFHHMRDQTDLRELQNVVSNSTYLVKVVVKVHISCTEITSQQSRMGGKNG